MSTRTRLAILLLLTIINKPNLPSRCWGILGLLCVNLGVLFMEIRNSYSKVQVILSSSIMLAYRLHYSRFCDRVVKYSYNQNQTK